MRPAPVPPAPQRGEGDLEPVVGRAAVEGGSPGAAGGRPPLPAHLLHRVVAVIAAMAVVALGMIIVVGPVYVGSASAAGAGYGCAPGEGVTVVVDFGSRGGVQVGCAPGQQASGLDVLAAAGFSVGAGAGAGTVCTLDGVPAEGYPYCWTTGGFWSYWKKGSWGEAWAFSRAGATAGPIPVDSVEGWYWAQDFRSQAPAGGETPAPPPPPAPSTTTTTEAPQATTSTSTTPSSSTTSTVPSQGGPTPIDPANPVSRSADAALDWLQAELGREGGALPAPVGSEPDWGLTLDALVALGLGGRSDVPEVDEAWRRFSSQVQRYTSGVDWGEPDSYFAGPLAKTVLALSTSAGAQPSLDVDVYAARLEGSMQSSGVDTGRFSDSGQIGDTSNGYTQALSVVALARTRGVPLPAISFVLEQQCPAGGFRIDYSASGGCTDDAAADFDATAVTIQALEAVSGGAAGPDLAADVVQARARAIAWRVGRQDPSGGFGGTGVTAALNANSTGLGAQALRGAGRTAEADAAAAWLVTMQLADPFVARAQGADAGAIAYNPASFAAAQAEGIAPMERDQWTRSTTQAVLGLGLPSMGAVVGKVDVPADGSTGGGPDGSGRPGSGAASGNRTGGRSLARTGATTTTTAAFGVIVLATGFAVISTKRYRIRTGR